MKVLLLGGTGPMGLHLTQLLSEKNMDVYVTSRSAHEDGQNIHYLLGNAKQDEFADKVLSVHDWDCIIDFMVYDTEEFKRRVVRLLSSTKQYIFLSSSRVYVDTDGYITEKTSRLLEECRDRVYLKTDEYALKKAREEDVLSQSGYHNYTIVRPYITYAENRLPLGVWEKETWTKRFLNKKDIVLPKIFLDKYTTIAYGKDVSFCISMMVGNKETIGETYNIVGSKAHKWGEILDYYLERIEELTGNKPNVIFVEQFSTDIRQIVKRWLSDIMHLRFTTTVGRIKCRNYQLIYDREFNRKFDNSRLLTSFPEMQFSDYKTSLGMCLQRFASKPKYNYISWPWEALQDRLTHQKTSINTIKGVRNKIKYIFIRYIVPQRYIVEF